MKRDVEPKNNEDVVVEEKEKQIFPSQIPTLIEALAQLPKPVISHNDIKGIDICWPALGIATEIEESGDWFVALINKSNITASESKRFHLREVEETIQFLVKTVSERI